MTSLMHPYTPGLIPDLCARCAEPPRNPVHGYGTANPNNVSPLRAVARAGDPGTSWEAAESVRDIRASQAEVLRLFIARGAMTDEQVAERYSGFQSPSGLRTRRAELVALGRLRDTGHRIVGRTGRRMIVWDVDPQAT